MQHSDNRRSRLSSFRSFDAYPDEAVLSERIGEDPQEIRVDAGVEVAGIRIRSMNQKHKSSESLPDRVIEQVELVQ